ncbi:MAG TPA: hypothetical protein VLL05_01360 [Terriglobales bacterium]|nr:hypothetical protein [Terriglobales bacterium]
MKIGISFSVEWWDNDVILFLARTSNGVFSGETTLYSGHDELAQLAETLNGFPKDAADHREVELGAFSTSHSGGGILMRFSCLDAVAHAAVDVKLRTQECGAFGDFESVALRIPIEAAAVDAFVNQLRQFKIAPEETITLFMAP